MAKKKKQQNSIVGAVFRKGSTNYRIVGILPDKIKQEVFTGSGKGPVLKTLKEIFSINFIVDKGRVAVPVKEYNVKTKEDHLFKDALHSLVSDLLELTKQRKRENKYLTSTDVKARLKGAQETARRVLGTTDTTVVLDGLSERKIRFIAGKNGEFLRKISTKCGGVEIFLDEKRGEEGKPAQYRLTVGTEQLSSLNKQRPGTRAHLLLVMSGLEDLANSWDGKEALAWENIDAIIKKAYAAQNVASDGSVLVTGEGKAVVIEPLFISEVAKSIYLEQIQKETCSADEDFQDRLAITFVGKGHEVRAKMENKDGSFFALLMESFSGLRISKDKKRTILTGPVESQLKAAQAIMAFSDFCEGHGNVRKLNAEEVKTIGKGVIEGLGHDQIKENLSLTSLSKRDDPDFDIKESYHVNLYANYTDNQQKFYNLMNGEKPIVVCLGPAGSGKTSIAMQVALSVVQTYFKGENDNAPSRLILCKKPSREGQKLGAVPGDMDEKMKNDYASFYDSLDRILAPCDANGRCDEVIGGLVRKELMREGVIQIVPPEFLLGRTFHNTFVVLDEAETLPTYQMRQMVTRIGDKSQLVILGDLDQDNGPLQVIKDEKEYYVPSDFELKEGNGFIKASHGVTYPLGPKDRIGEFNFNDAKIETFRPANGLAYVTMLSSQSPVTAFVSMDEKDIRRSLAAAWGVHMDRFAAVPYNAGKQPVTAQGNFDAEMMRKVFERTQKEAMRPNELKQGVVVPIQGFKVG